MDLPVATGIVLAFVASTGATFDPAGVFGEDAYFDSLTMFVSFLLGGRTLALKMRNRAAATLEAAVARTPALARRLEADGSTALVSPQRLRVSDRVHVLAGEAFAADGKLVAGSTEVDEALLTGESRPVAKGVGDEAVAGSINLGGPVVQQVDRLGADTRYEGIVALMRGALADRPALLRTADRIAGPFLWTVLLCAAGAAAAWSIIDPARAVSVAVAVLIVTCPCALSLAAPSALLAGAGAMARRGLLVQRLDAIEALARIDTVCFDKTGTLTENTPGLAGIEVQENAREAGLDEAALLTIAASLARQSTHPIAVALAAAPRATASTELQWLAAREEPGLGIEGTSSCGQRYRLGSRAWATGSHGGSASEEPETHAATLEAGPETWLGDAGGALARFLFAETLRADAHASIKALQGAGLSLLMLSGDRKSRVADVAKRLGIADATGEASPADKLAAVASVQAAGHRVAMVGDGINDAPVMARADVSFAVGRSTALARSRADIALLSGSLADLVWAHALARRTLRIVRQNLGWAIAYNAACVPLALLGVFPPWAAGLGMAASSVFVILNSLRVDRRHGQVANAESTTP
jgi:Cu2+-exporting ATPase